MPQTLIDTLLDEQRQLTVVEAFAESHQAGAVPSQAPYYRDLIPLTTPGPGEQFAFEVDLDSCSGCKACVTACHNLNGLEEEETWRSVGLLHGGTSELPMLQHVTTACHHCIEPACLHGCPVNAYDKDPITGIVRHLDDQCIGCQYCMLKCPYDVPRYSKSKGIVRKCDMCHDRLAADEAPACVQACPNQAIRIQIVDRRTVVEESESNVFLPGAPDAGYTIPTTTYRTTRPLPRNLLPADYFSVQSGHGHLPLVFMLVLTQMSVGAFVVNQVLYSYVSLYRGETAGILQPLHLLMAVGLGLSGLAASIFHLGRPLYAFRALLGLRSSWLSREILGFGLFATVATSYAAVVCWDSIYHGLPPAVEAAMSVAASLAGVLAVFCSVMIYVDTKRPSWGAATTAAKFFLTAVILGIPASLIMSLAATVLADELSVHEVMSQYGWQLCRILAVAVAAKLTLELLVFGSLRHKQHTPLKRTAMLMQGELSMTTLKRFFFGMVGGLALPMVLLGETALAGDRGYQPLFFAIVALLVFLLLIVGELLERYLFFAASVAPKMPGIPAT